MQQVLQIGTLGKPHGIKGAISIYSKTQPVDLIFSLDLYLQDGTRFEVSQYEMHHTKTVLFSPSIEDRTAAEKWKGTPLYCDRDDFFSKHNDQIFDDLCKGYMVFDLNGKQVGILTEVTIMADVLMMVILDGDQTIHLGLKIKAIDHQQQQIQLDYTYNDH